MYIDLVKINTLVLVTRLQQTIENYYKTTIFKISDPSLGFKFCNPCRIQGQSLVQLM
jgi:hypothetical protein